MAPQFQHYDTASKAAADSDPESMVHLLLKLRGQKTNATVSTLDSDFRSVVKMADRIFQIHEVKPWTLLVEFLAYSDSEVEGRMLCYSGLASIKYKMPVWSVLVILSRKVDPSASIGGSYKQRLPTGEVYCAFQYQVVKLYEIPVEELLKESVFLLPYAVLGQYPDSDLPLVVGEITRRLELEVSPTEAIQVIANTRLLAGLRFPAEEVNHVLPELTKLKDSAIYQELVGIGRNEGRVEGLTEGERKMLLLQGQLRFGEPGERALAALRAINDPTQLETLCRRMFQAHNWDEVLFPEETP